MEDIVTPATNLSVTVAAPPTLTPDAAAVVTIEYRNTGPTAMPAPVLQLAASQHGHLGAFLTLDPALKNVSEDSAATPAGFGPTAMILASGGTAGVLGAGESGAVAVYYGGWSNTQWDAAEPGVAFSVSALSAANAKAIDWPSMASGLRPAGVPTAAWPALLSNLTAQLGATWGSYVQRLDGDAAYLQSLGENYTAVDRLWELELQ